MQIKEKLLEYKTLTVELINALENEEYIKLNDLFNEREKIIDCTNDLSYSMEEFKKICNELGIIELETKLKQLIKDKMLKVKKSINNIKRSRNAHMSYNKNFINNSFFVKKTV